MDPLHLCIALGPLAVYLLLLGAINLSPRPFLTRGSCDTAVLAVAISGFVVAGPMELFLPEVAAARFGGFVWLLMLVGYALVVMLLAMLMRPRIVIYNMSGDQLRPILADVVGELDPEARWADEGLVLPNLGVQLHVESFAALQNVQLVATGVEQNSRGWRRLEAGLRAALGDTQVAPNRRGFSFILFGLLMIALVAFSMFSDQQAVVRALNEMLRL
jgi:hypothetical protein